MTNIPGFIFKLIVLLNIRFQGETHSIFSYTLQKPD